MINIDYALNYIKYNFILHYILYKKNYKYLNSLEHLSDY